MPQNALSICLNWVIEMVTASSMCVFHSVPSSGVTRTHLRELFPSITWIGSITRRLLFLAPNAELWRTTTTNSLWISRQWSKMLVKRIIRLYLFCHLVFPSPQREGFLLLDLQIAIRELLRSYSGRVAPAEDRRGPLHNINKATLWFLPASVAKLTCEGRPDLARPHPATGTG